MALDGMIFDLDGTLVDTNGLHVRAWLNVFERHGYRVSADRVWLEVGTGGDKLIPNLFGREIDRRDGDAMRAEHPKEFARLARSEGVRPFPGAKELLEELRRREVRTALVTSSGPTHLETIESCTELACNRLLDVVVTGEDADATKPSPAPIVAGLAKLKLSPAQCAMVGDSRYDAEACRAAGVVCLGVLSGREDQEPVLRAAGARAVYRDVADLLARLDDALALASPGPAHVTRELMDSLMRQALDVAREAMDDGEAPIGCLLAGGDGRVIATGYNRMNATQNKTAHAEMVTFAHAAGKIPLDARDLILVSTLEPCVMCTGAAMEAAVDTILYALPAPADSGTRRVACPTSPESQMPRIIGGILARESRALFEEFLRRNPRPEQKQFAEQLLALAGEDSG